MGEWAGQPNYFPEKIIAGLDLSIPKKCTLNDLLAEVTNPTDVEFIAGATNPHYGHAPKLHTIRQDRHNRWKTGMKIHPVINHRSKDQFQFAPEFPCSGVQSIKIKYYKSANPWMYFDISVWDENTNKGRGVIVSVDNKILSSSEVWKLAINDGFESLEQFFAYFNEDFEGKIIHWTDLRY